MDLPTLVSEIRNLDCALVQRAKSAVNVALTARNWLVGAYIVEFEQNGKDRAKYGEELIPELARRLKEEGVKGLLATNLKMARLFYHRYPEIGQALTDESLPIRQTPSDGSGKEFSLGDVSILRAPTGGSLQRAQDPADPQVPHLPPREILVRLSFSHLVELLKIDDPLKRAFYEIEAVKGRWSVRVLKRQVGSLLFERTGLSRDKERVLALANEGTPVPPDLIRDLFVSRYQLHLPDQATLTAFINRELEAL